MSSTLFFYLNACLPHISFYFLFFSHPLIRLFIIFLFFRFFTFLRTHPHGSLSLALSIPQNEERHCSTKPAKAAKHELHHVIVTDLSFTVTHNPTMTSSTKPTNQASAFTTPIWPSIFNDLLHYAATSNCIFFFYRDLGKIGIQKKAKGNIETIYKINNNNMESNRDIFKLERKNLHHSISIKLS